ncbi:MAG: hypothetical protein NVSMB52_03040 [Chloroflexota bacterium]
MSDIGQIIVAIETRLPQLARQVIRTHLDMDNPANLDFLENPDGREQHQTHWHQWGIITHTQTFLRHYADTIPAYLSEWGFADKVEVCLNAEIDSVSRRDLLRISILLHDIGKFAARTQGRASFHFARHERMSGEIIRNEIDIESFGLSPAQIEYVALTAEDHFVLGLIRRRAREEGVYDSAFTDTPEFAQLSRRIQHDHPDDYIEIGILFLGDSLAKADRGAGPERALGQYDLNVAVAQRYLGVVLQESV